ncbi:uncharacterized protein LOC113278964 [Papaver somniferum]|uniref:uncharacterized protein LOC113278964 n=1 Tax=Papaver somniferum TaxID=3469 RepID=UPI000E702A8F|nr:uncharacterized protein LOC113278964 [Papaver somniferum]
MDMVLNNLNTMIIAHHIWDTIKTNLLSMMHILAKKPYGDFHTYQQQPCSGYVSQAPRWDNSTYNWLHSSCKQILNGLQDMQQRLDQLDRNRENVTQTNFYNTFSYSTPDRSYDHSPIQREESWEKEPILDNGGKRVNVRKLAQTLYKLEDDGASEELVDEISRTIRMELNRRHDQGWETDEDSYYDESEIEDDCVENDQPLDIFDDIGVVDSTLDLYNDQTPIQKVHEYDEPSVLQNFLATRFESNEEECDRYDQYYGRPN